MINVYFNQKKFIITFFAFYYWYSIKSLLLIINIIITHYILLDKLVTLSVTKVMNIGVVINTILLKKL